MTLKQKTIRGVMWSGLEVLGGQGTTLLVFAALAHLLRPDAFGLLALAGVFIAFTEIFVNQGLSTAIVQRKELDQEHLDTAFWISLAMGVGLAAISALVAPFIASLYGEPRLTDVIQWLSLTFILSGLATVPNGLLTRDMAFRNLAIRRIAGNAGGGAVGLVMAFSDWGVWSLVGQQLATALIGTVVVWSTSGWCPRLKFSSAHYRSMVVFGANVAGFSILNFFSRRSDAMLIGYFLGAEALGYYTVGYRVLRLMTDVFANTTAKVSLPLFARMQAEHKQLLGVFYRTIGVNSLIAFPAFAAAAVFAPDITKWMFGHKWLATVPVMQVLVWVGILHALVYFHSNLFLAVNRPDVRLKIALIDSLANVVGFFAVLYLGGGIYHVALVYVVRAYLFFPIPLWFLNRVVGVSTLTYVRNLYPAILGTTAFTLVAFITRQFTSRALSSEVTAVAISAVLGGAAFLLTISCVTPEFVKQLRDMMAEVKQSRSSKTMRRNEPETCA